jgi:hypothetical protein
VVPELERIDTGDAIEFSKEPIELLVHTGGASISLPYWFDGEAARDILELLLEYAALVREHLGLAVWDPQLEQWIDNGTTVADLEPIYAVGRDAVRRITEERPAAPPSPRRAPMDWDDYEITDPGFVEGPVREADRESAELHFVGLMELREERKRELAKLVRHSGGFELDGSDESIRRLSRWFCEHVDPDPDDPDRLVAEWYSVARDIGLWLGDLLIERHPHLEWRLYVWDKRGPSYQRPVIMGFKVPEPKYHQDFERAVVVTGVRVVNGLDVDEDDDFLDVMRSAEELAEGKL